MNNKLSLEMIKSKFYKRFITAISLFLILVTIVSCDFLASSRESRERQNDLRERIDSLKQERELLNKKYETVRQELNRRDNANAKMGGLIID